MKTKSAFYPAELVARARANISNDDWARSEAARIVEATRPWMEMSDDELWGLMFGHTLDRTLHVWSDGHCPACGKDVPMYTWEIDAFKAPWKVTCPHCREQFPKNDFEAFYRSGLDKQGIFRRDKANRDLLFNAEHPDPNDPLHRFGVDDGDGYVDGKKRWRFIAAYLYYGQWRQLVIRGGILKLAAAHVATGDPVAAHKAAILLDRVADLYPDFDFGTQGWTYESNDMGSGYVSTWHDACQETREMALAYDQIFEAIRTDKQLVVFLSKKAVKHDLPNKKTSFADIQRNIEDRILRDALAHTSPDNWNTKMHAGYPLMQIAIATIETVLGWPENRQRVMGLIGDIIKKSTAVDGVTGMKGLAEYSAYTVVGLARFLGQFDRIDGGILPALFRRYPSLRKTWRFFLDTWCMESYYPNTGDVNWFASRVLTYHGADFATGPKASRNPPEPLSPSPHTFLWRLHELTGEAGYVQALYLENDSSLKHLPRDLFAQDAAEIRQAVGAVIAREGESLKLPSVNKRQWHLAILRSGEGDSRRALWLDYDSGGDHAHMDGMNLGLFARGLDLLPDFGYPPVQRGGWYSPAVKWYTKTAAHNTVVVDGQNQAGTPFGGNQAAGETTLWADGRGFRTVRASGVKLYPDCRQYERTAALIDLPGAGNFYVIDIFRVIGGREHAKFTHSHFGKVETTGLCLKPGCDYGQETFMRNFRRDPSPQPGWSVLWNIEDRYGFLPAGEQVRFGYTDLTTGAEANLCEAWVVPGGYNCREEAWIPRVMTRRTADEGELQSTFVAVMEPFGKMSALASIRRLPLHDQDGAEWPDSAVAVEVTHADGRDDLLIAADAENPLGQKPSLKDGRTLIQKDWNVRLDGEMAFIRRKPDGTFESACACRATALSVGSRQWNWEKAKDLAEITEQE